MYKFVDVLNVENPNIIKRLVVYIYKAFELRSNYNYNQCQTFSYYIKMTIRLFL